jgi:hypothetical protein
VILALGTLAVSLSGQTTVIPRSSVTGGGTITSAQLLAPDGTAGAPSYSFASEPTLGFYRLSATNISTSTGAAINSFAFIAAAAGYMRFIGSTVLDAPSNGALRITPSAQTTGVQFAVGGLPTVGTCGTGTVTAKSTNNAGHITPTGATACTVIFHTTPAFTNTPFCVATAGTTLEPMRITAASTTSFVVNFTTASNTFTYVCLGPI